MNTPERECAGAHQAEPNRKGYGLVCPIPENLGDHYYIYEQPAERDVGIEDFLICECGAKIRPEELE